MRRARGGEGGQEQVRGRGSLTRLGASRSRRRLVLEFWLRQVRGSAWRRALSVSFPRKHWAGAKGRAGSREDKEEEKEGPWHCRLPRPQARQGRAGVASAPRGGLRRARLRGGDCGGRVNSA